MLRLFERPQPEPAHLEIAHDGEVYRVALKRSPRSHRFTLRDQDRDPRRAAHRAGARVARRRRGNSPSAIPPGSASGSRACRISSPSSPRRSRRCAGSTIASCTGQARAASSGSRRASDGPLICVAGERPHVPRRVADFLKREAHRDIEAAVARHARSIGVKPKRIAVRDTVSRWGSCSATGGLSFSWRLILAPPFVLDYLAAHEVAHLVHLNHSPKFWSLLRRACPETNRAEAWLKAHGANLHRYGEGR